MPTTKARSMERSTPRSNVRQAEEGLFKSDGRQSVSYSRQPTRWTPTIITCHRTANRRCHIRPRSTDTRCTPGVRAEDHFSSDEVQPDLLSPPQVCGWRPLPGRLACTEAGTSSPRPGPPVSWNFGLTSPDIQSQAGFLGGLVLRTTGEPEPAALW